MIRCDLKSVVVGSPNCVNIWSPLSGKSVKILQIPKLMVIKRSKSGSYQKVTLHCIVLSHRGYRQHHRGTCQSPAGSASVDAAARRRSEEVSMLVFYFFIGGKGFLHWKSNLTEIKTRYTFPEACQRQPFITNKVIFKVMYFPCRFSHLRFWTTFVTPLFSGISHLLRKLGSCQFQQSSQQEQYEMRRYTCKLYGEKVLYVIRKHWICLKKSVTWHRLMKICKLCKQLNFMVQYSHVSCVLGPVVLDGE